MNAFDGPLMHGPPCAKVVVDGQQYSHFAGTGYLGLQGHPEVMGAACEAVQQYGLGMRDHLRGFGNTRPVLEVERLSANCSTPRRRFIFRRAMRAITSFYRCAGRRL